MFNLGWRDLETFTVWDKREEISLEKDFNFLFFGALLGITNIYLDPRETMLISTEDHTSASGFCWIQVLLENECFSSLHCISEIENLRDRF